MTWKGLLKQLPTNQNTRFHTMDNRPPHIGFKKLANYICKVIALILVIITSVSCTFGQTKDDSVPQFGISTSKDSAHHVEHVKLNADSANRAVIDTTPQIDTALAAKKLRRHSPLKAALFSAVLPGLGQAYNRRYWKIPIIYAGFGGLGYAIYFTSSNFKGFRDAYRYNLAYPNANYAASFGGASDIQSLKDYRDYYKKY
ncbi:MAG: hypothetical protein JWO06_1478, partial [Bacteroidota bacterium]|nr:hypothetical protein [Bacteroidota bacterium]